MRLLRCPLVCWLLLAPLFAFAQSIAPSVASISRSQTVLEGAAVTLTVSADGTTPFTFQWRKEGQAIAGATSTTLALDPVRTTDAGTYSVAITNSVSTTVSDPVLLAVTPASAPSISHSGTITFTIGSALDVYVYADGSGPMTYVWKKDGAVIAGATSRNYTKATTTADDAGVYQVTVTNIAGSATSGNIVVTASVPTAPRFTSQPTNITDDIGSYRSVYYDVSGTQPMTHTLKKGAAVVTSSTWGGFSFYPLTAESAGSYTIEVTNNAGTATSDTFTITLNPAKAPKVVLNSAGTTLRVGQSLYLSSYLQQGTAPVTYQWYKDGVAIPAATDYSYSKSNVQVGDTGNYTVTATNAVGSSTSPSINVAVNVLRPPVIHSHPWSQTIQTGSYASLSVWASGENLTYVWKKDGVVLPSADSSTLYVHDFSSAKTGTYTVEVTNPQGSATSEPAVLALRQTYLPVILSGPESQTVEAGASLSFSVEVDAVPEPTFQWYRDGVALPDATSSGYYKSTVAASDGGNFHVVVSNSAGSVTSPTAVVTVETLRAPRIRHHPASAALLPGGYHGLEVQLVNTYGCSFQWKRDGVEVAGATNRSLWINGAQPGDAGTYTCVITNAAGTVTTEAADVRVDTHQTLPVIIFSNGSSSANTGESVYYSINTSVSTATIQWFLDGVAIPGFSGNSINFAAGPATVGNYTAKVTTGGVTTTSRQLRFTLLDEAQAPVIRTHPRGLARDTGLYAAISVHAQGTQPLQYQWKKDGITVPLATQSALYFQPLTSSDYGKYTVVVSNAHGTATSLEAEIKAPPGRAPVILGHPPSTGLSSNHSLSLYVGATGSYPLTYQWKRNGVDLPGQNSYSLHRSASAEVVGRYTVVVSNAHGSVTSQEAVVTHVGEDWAGPRFTAQPGSLTAYAGASATFSASATGRGTLTYQWRKNGSDIAGATSSSYTLTRVTSTDAANYTVIATDQDGSVSSEPAVLTVNSSTAPVITAHPNDAYVTAGSSVSFSANATGIPAPALAWYRNGSPVAGATGPTLSLPGVGPDQAGSYTFVATNSAGSATSRAATLHVLSQPAAGPVITTQPRSITINPGHTATFTVEATGSPAPAYQWRKDNVPISGAHAATLTLGAVQANQAGTYTVEVSNAFGSVISQEAKLQVGEVVTGVYLGSIGSNQAEGSWALLVMSDQTGRFLALLPDRNQAIVTSVTVGADGRFTFGQTTSAEADGLTSTAARYYTGPGQGTIKGAAVTGTLSGLNLSFSGTAATPGATAAHAGYYQAVPSYTAAGAVYAIATPDGRSFGVVVDAAAVFGGVGTLANGKIEIRSASGPVPALIATLDPARSTLTGELQFSGRPNVTVAPAAPPSGAERLVNLSTRARAGSGSDTLIAGFVISGSESKSVLVRAAGPALVAYQVEGAMTDPFLDLYRGDSKIFDNDNWQIPSKSMIDDAVARVGAFPFPVDSKDSAIFMNLIPGAYSAHVTNKSGTSGVALIEVYEYSGSATAPRLLNLSARSPVGRGDDILIVGLVVTGDAPKRYLIRGVGPTLTDFKVTGVLQNPRLQLFRGKELVRENDDWSAGGDAGDIAAAAAATGAFALPAGSKDAALLVYLPPGAYTAHVSGVGDTTGVALIEAYEVP